MEAIMNQLVTSGPVGVAAGVLIYIVRQFLASLDERDKREGELRRELMALVEKNTLAMTELREIIRMKLEK